VHIRAVYQKCKIIIIIIFNPLISQKKIFEKRFFEEIKEGVKYYMSAFLIYSTHAKPS